MSGVTEVAVIAPVAAVAALLGSAIVAGVFFAFSSFVMGALARLPAAEGIAAMQSINVVVLNRSFLGTFVGTAVVSLVVAGLAVAGWGSPQAPWFLAGALAYLVGTFLVTGLGNVPLNDRLAAVCAADPEAVPLWEHYLEGWTRLNTLRTVAAAAAVLLFTAGLRH
ncbi:anthrone oxygenase family protein [Lentisalinibacter sediminis]|uniref:anthrone oxygenase family protein n=1 Tax=Lentisalinibacter sediminis TaxID=2992237 RepID=UPI0038667EF3